MDDDAATTAVAADTSKNSSDVWRAIIDCLPVDVYTVDADGSILSANRAPQDPARGDVVGRMLLDLIESPYRDEMRVALSRACRGGEVCAIEVRRIDRRECRVYLAPLRIHAAPAGAVLTFTNMTDRNSEESLRKQDELQVQTRYRLIEALSRSERKARLRVENLQEVVFEIDDDGKLVFVNRAWETLLGYPVKESLGKSLSSFIWDTDGERLAECFQSEDPEDCRHSKLIDGAELRFAHAKGTAVWVSVSSISNEEGLRLGVLHDLTDRKRSETVIRRANEELEELVANRTRELQGAHAKLVEASRVAGMAEVATGILHNVGNVLNSVSVSVGLVDEHVRHSKCAHLSRVARLLETHSDGLADFITKDPRGRRVPELLIALAGEIETERDEVTEELESLRKNVERIKNIIITEQAAASVSGVDELTTVEEVIDAALGAFRRSCERRGVCVEKLVDPLPPAFLDRHRIIQILVNLFRNAQDALADSERSNKVLKVQATPCGNDRVRISVTDNGIGVRPENLERLFEHGFTTKKGGHGFGLHSSANAAQAMGGSLTCHCNGETTFTLDLPFSPTQEGGKDEHDHSKRG